ncbi:MAG: hypothetical protein WCW02_01515 [Candidatus Buchananbacteria bacterium]
MNQNNEENKIDDGDLIIITVEISKEEIQSLASGNFGRELTDIEINRIKECWYDSDAVFDNRCGLILAAIEDATDEKNGWWNQVDKDFIDQQKSK